MEISGDFVYICVDSGVSFGKGVVTEFRANEERSATDGRG